MGDPAGIGGELTLHSWLALHRSGPTFVVLDDPGRLRRLATAISLPVPIVAVDDIEDGIAHFPLALPVLPIVLASTPVPGHPDPANGRAIIASIKQATLLAKQGRASAIVTNPISKAALYKTGFAFPGHTEYLGELAGTTEAPVMMISAPQLKVVPVTVHVALAEAIQRLDSILIERTGRSVARALVADFGIERPRLAVAGLNPHAGESGAMGREDIEIILPAVKALQLSGIAAIGPLPPDSMFTESVRETYDAAICMYHDQALIPVKTLAFDQAVNVTLNLQIVRTSPDHGTAFGIAGKNVASPASLLSAIGLAHRIALRRWNNRGET